jgi:hypothetical protein
MVVTLTKGRKRLIVLSSSFYFLRLIPFTQLRQHTKFRVRQNERSINTNKGMYKYSLYSTFATLFDYILPSCNYKKVPGRTCIYRVDEVYFDLSIFDYWQYGITAMYGSSKLLLLCSKTGLLAISSLPSS